MEKQRHKSFFNWSGGKDSALALYYALQNQTYSIEKLLTNVNEKHRRISMHGVREILLDQQAQSIGLPLQKVMLPEQPSMHEYEQEVNRSMAHLKAEGFTHSIFGDIFLEDLKKYREDQLFKMGILAIFPLWKKDTKRLINEFIDLGFKAMVVCVQANKLDKSFAGRMVDKDFIHDLPANVDPCGENGEFHTFVFDGPIFKNPILFNTGETVYKDYNSPASQSGCEASEPALPANRMGFWFTDLLPVG